jgi:hypothetical protein
MCASDESHDMICQTCGFAPPEPPPPPPLDPALLVCVLCVQRIDDCLEDLAYPSTDDVSRSVLEGRVQRNKRWIQENKDKTLKCEEELQAESRGLSSKRGEPVGLLCR